MRVELFSFGFQFSAFYNQSANVIFDNLLSNDLFFSHDDNLLFHAVIYKIIEKK